MKTFQLYFLSSLFVLQGIATAAPILDRPLKEIGEATLVISRPIAFERESQATSFIQGKMYTHNDGATAFGTECVMTLKKAPAEERYFLNQDEKLKIMGVTQDNVHGYPIEIVVLLFNHSTIDSIRCFNLVGSTTIKGFREAFGSYLSIEGEADPQPEPSPTPSESPSPQPEPGQGQNPAALQAFKQSLRKVLIDYTLSIYSSLNAPVHSAVANAHFEKVQSSKEYQRCLHKGLLRTKKIRDRNCNSAISEIQLTPVILASDLRIKKAHEQLLTQEQKLISFPSTVQNQGWKLFANTSIQTLLTQTKQGLIGMKDHIQSELDQIESQCESAKLEDKASCLLGAEQVFYQTWIHDEFGKTTQKVTHDLNQVLSRLENL